MFCSHNWGNKTCVDEDGADRGGILSITDESSELYGSSCFGKAYEILGQNFQLINPAMEELKFKKFSIDWGRQLYNTLQQPALVY